MLSKEMSMKNCNNTTGNRTRYVLACSCRVPQLNNCLFQIDSRCISVFCCIPPSLDSHPKSDQSLYSPATLFWSFCFSSSVWFPTEILSLRSYHQISHQMASQFWLSYFYCCCNIWFSRHNLYFIISSDSPTIFNFY